MNWFSDIKTNIHKGILAAGAALSLMLAGGVFMNAQAVASGQEVIVTARGFDPRDFLAGHYVRLSYDFSTPSAANIPACFNRKNATVWVRLEAGKAAVEPYASGLACRRGDLQTDGGLIMRGRSTGYSRVEYGVERFYAAQKDAERIEKALRGRFDPETPPEKLAQVRAVLSIGPDGRARLKALLLGDERVDLSWL